MVVGMIAYFVPCPGYRMNGFRIPLENLSGDEESGAGAMRLQGSQYIIDGPGDTIIVKPFSLRRLFIPVLPKDIGKKVDP